VSWGFSPALLEQPQMAGAQGCRPPAASARAQPVRSTALAMVLISDVQIAARHADPRTTMRYDRARKNLDRHPNYILAAFMASGT
jgi:integrase/recombinase XerD